MLAHKQKADVEHLDPFFHLVRSLLVPHQSHRTNFETDFFNQKMQLQLVNSTTSYWTSEISVVVIDRTLVDTRIIPSKVDST